MKTDSIFYRLFQTFPEAFFELIDRQASDARAYEFASVELKQTAFRIDGIFLPVPNLPERPIYFLEVQFQKDVEFYARFFSEIFLYLRLYAPTKAWQAVVVFARASMEPIEIEPYRVLLESEQVTRLYLNELEDAEQSLGVGIIKLVVEPKKRTPERVRQLVNQARLELADESLRRRVLDLVETIVLYKFPLIDRQELAIMFGLNELRKTRYYQEVRQEAREELQEEVRQQVLQQVRQELQQEVQQEVRQQVRQELQEEVQQEVRQQVRQELQEEVRQQVLQELQQEVRQQVQQELQQEVQQEALALVKRQLLRRLGVIDIQMQERIAQLSIHQLENLADALLDFSNEADLAAWLNNSSNQTS